MITLEVHEERVMEARADRDKWRVRCYGWGAVAVAALLLMLIVSGNALESASSCRLGL